MKESELKVKRTGIKEGKWWKKVKEKKKMNKGKDKTKMKTMMIEKKKKKKKTVQSRRWKAGI